MAKQKNLSNVKKQIGLVLSRLLYSNIHIVLYLAGSKIEGHNIDRLLSVYLVPTFHKVYTSVVLGIRILIHFIFCINPFTLNIPIESIVCYFHTFENKLGIKRKFTKYLK